MKSLILSISYWFLATSLSIGQENHVFFGQVVDANTKQGLPYASLGVPTMGIGASSDIEGFFQIEINSFLPNDSLYISYVGYERFGIPLSSLVEGESNQLALKESLLQLREITVVAAEESVAEITKKTRKLGKVNFNKNPYILYGIYREHLQEDNQFTGFTKAYGLFYMNKFHKTLKKINSPSHTADLVQWKHIQRSDYPNTNEGLTYLGIGHLLQAKNHYLHHGPLGKQLANQLDFKIDSLTSYEGEEVYAISFRHKQRPSHYHGTMLVNAKDYALISLKVKNSDQRLLSTTWPSKKIDDLTVGEFSMQFAKSNGKYFLQHIQLIQEKGNQKRMTEIAAGTFNTTKAEYLNDDQRQVLFHEMLNPVVNYDHKFWDRVKIAELEYYDEMASDLSKSKPLKEQFAENHGQRLIPLPKGYNSYEEIQQEHSLFDLIGDF